MNEADLEKLLTSSSTDKYRTDLAIVILIGKRYFVSFNKSGRLNSAWHLSGASLFPAWQYESIKKDCVNLIKKGYDPVIKLVNCS